MNASIIIPCYNGEATVADAVNSALAQTYPDCEVIVVDDGSTDNSLGVLESFASVITLLTGPNRGGAAARNRGVAAATGDYVQFLDADDLLEPKKIETSIGAIRELPRDIIPVTDWRYEHLEESVPAEVLAFPAQDEDVLSAVLENGLQTSAPLHRRSTLVEIGGFREHLKCSQEKDLHLRLAATGHSFYRVPYVGVIVRQTQNSVSSDYTKVLLQRLDVYKHAASILEERRASHQWRQSLARSLTRDAFDLCRANRLQDALRYINFSAELDPQELGRGGLQSPFPRVLAGLLGPRLAAYVYVALKRGLVATSSRNLKTRSRDTA